MISQQIIQFLQDFAPAILFIGLLFGPTLLFFVVRAFVGSSSAHRQAHLGLIEPVEAVPLEQLIDSGTLWLCTTCRGLNLDVAVRCYRCGGTRPAPQASDDETPAIAPEAPVTAPGPGPLRSPVPVMAASAALGHEPVAVPVSRNGNGASATPVRLRPWCPLLGVRDDPRTVYSFPHADHRCHASPKLAPIDPAQQAAYCLTATYPSCMAYRSLAARLSSDEARATVAVAESH